MRQNAKKFLLLDITLSICTRIAKTGKTSGYLFISTFSDYRGNYDFSKREKLKIGTNELDEVYALFGYPLEKNC